MISGGFTPGPRPTLLSLAFPRARYRCFAPYFMSFALSAAKESRQRTPRLQRRLVPRPSGRSRTRPACMICQEVTQGTTYCKADNKTAPGSNNASGQSSGLRGGADGERIQEWQCPRCPALGGPEGPAGLPADPGRRPSGRSGNEANSRARRETDPL